MAPLGLTVQIRWTNGLSGWFTVSQHPGTGQVSPGSELALVLATCAVGDVLVLFESKGQHHAATVTHIWHRGVEG
jgi:hypothetical protein